MIAFPFPSAETEEALVRWRRRRAIIAQHVHRCAYRLCRIVVFSKTAARRHAFLHLSLVANAFLHNKKTAKWYLLLKCDNFSHKNILFLLTIATSIIFFPVAFCFLLFVFLVAFSLLCVFFSNRFQSFTVDDLKNGAVPHSQVSTTRCRMW